MQSDPNPSIFLTSMKQFLLISFLIYVSFAGQSQDWKSYYDQAVADYQSQRYPEALVKAEKAYSFKERGIYNVTYFNLSFGKTNYQYGSNKSHLGVAIENITGFQLNRLVGAGLGIGFDNYYATGNDANVLSIFSEVRGYLSRQNVSPYYSFSSGVGFPMVNTKDNLNLTGHRGGLMVHPAIGLRFGASSHINFFADIGAKYQRIYYNQINTGSENHYRITYLRWVLRGGIVF